MQIGKPTRTIVVHPLERPVPRREPQPSGPPVRVPEPAGVAERAEMSVPDRIAPILAWRSWGLTDHGRLFSPISGREWYPGRPFRAFCRGRAHRAPDRSCECGVYATKRAPDVPLSAVAGPVYLWGRVIEHELGYRAEFAYPHELTLVYGHATSPFDQRSARELERTYRVPVNFFIGDELTPAGPDEQQRLVFLRRRVVPPAHAAITHSVRLAFDQGSRGEALALVLGRARKIDLRAIVTSARVLDQNTPSLDGEPFLHADRVRRRLMLRVSGPRGRQIVEVSGSDGGYPQGWTGSQHVVLDTVSGSVQEVLRSDLRQQLLGLPFDRQRQWRALPLRVRASLGVALEAWLQLIAWADPPALRSDAERGKQLEAQRAAAPSR